MQLLIHACRNVWKCVLSLTWNFLPQDSDLNLELIRKYIITQNTTKTSNSQGRYCGGLALAGEA